MIKLTHSHRMTIIITVFCIFTIFSISSGYSDTIEQTYNQELNKFLEEFHEDPLENPIKIMFFNQIESYLQGIIRLGPPALPFIYRTMKNSPESEVPLLYIAMRKISKKDFHQDDFTVSQSRNSLEMTRRYIQWWEKDRFQTKERFDELYGKLKTLPDGKEKETVRQKLLFLGIPAIQYAVEKVEAGETDFMDAIDYWTDNSLKKEIEKNNVAPEKQREYCLEWWEKNKNKWELPPQEEKKQ